jgi:hypothetical protein
VFLCGLPEQSKFQKGESSSTRASVSTVVVGLEAPSILGKYEWVSKAVGCVEVGFVEVGFLSTVTGELNGGLGFADREPCVVGLGP